MIAIGNGEPCPFCAKEQLKAQQSDKRADYKDIFINSPDVNFIDHLMEEHSKDMATYLFSNKNIGM